MPESEESKVENAYYAAVDALLGYPMQYVWIAVPERHEDPKYSDWAWDVHLRDREKFRRRFEEAMLNLAAPCRLRIASSIS